MTTLVKDAPAIASALEWSRARAPEAPRDTEDPRIVALRAELVALEEQIAEQARLFELAIAKAAEDARAEAQAALVRDEATRVAAVEAAMRALDQRFDEALFDIEALSLLMNEEALGRVFNTKADLGELVSRSIERQMSLVRQDAVVRILVSGVDFPSESALTSLAARLALTHTNVAIDVDLAPGESRLELKLGEVEISLPRYWRELKALLSATRDEGAPP